MTWQILEVEPAHAVCDQCKRHDCGIVDGQHKWVRTGIVDEYGDHIVIGHGCVNAWAENMGISREVVEREVLRPPTDEETLRIMREALDAINPLYATVAKKVNKRAAATNHPLAGRTSDMGQQTDQGTPSPETGGSGTQRARRASVRKQGNVSTGKTNRTRKHAEGAKDSH